MIVVHSSWRLRAAALVAVAIVAAGACGGSSSKGTAPTTKGSNNSGAATTTSTTGGGNGSCYTKAGTQKARVRFVNLYTNSTYPGGSIDVYQGYGADDPCGKKLATVSFGTASDYLDVTASDESGNWSATAYVAGSTAKDHQIISQSETWKGGEQVTLVFEGGEGGNGLPPAAGGDQVFFEKSSNSTDAESFPTVPGKAVLGIAATSLQYVEPSGAWVAGVSGQSGCLLAVGDTSTTRTNIGGTELVQYPVAAGSLSVGLYKSDPGTCTGTPDIGPASVTTTAGSRTFVFAYGTTPTSLKLVVLPIAS